MVGNLVRFLGEIEDFPGEIFMFIGIEELTM